MISLSSCSVPMRMPTIGVSIFRSPVRSYPELFRVTGPLLSLVFRTEDVCVFYLLQDLYTKLFAGGGEWRTCVCVSFIINQTPATGGDHCHGPQRAAHSAGLRAIPSTEPGPQPLLVTYKLSSLAVTPGEPTPYVCMYVSMVHTHMWYVRGYVLWTNWLSAEFRETSKY